MKNFEEQYWKANYSEPETMDGIANVKEHTGYLKNLLALEYIDISSIVDLGMGLGYLFRSMLRQFKPAEALGIEPSKYAFKRVKKDWLRPVPSTKLTLLNSDLHSWCQNKTQNRIFDLGLCTSVFQYIDNKQLPFIVETLAKRVKYLYLTVPTDKELKRQVSDLEFHDTYAIRRSRNWYQKLLRPHFTFLSSRFLESKIHFNEDTTSFTDLLYRF